METDLGDFVLGVFATLCALIVLGMLGFGPQILEWLEGVPRDARMR
jgi:hypothetical protein